VPEIQYINFITDKRVIFNTIKFFSAYLNIWFDGFQISVFCFGLVLNFVCVFRLIL